MLDHSLRRELLSLRDDDLTLREELLATGELRGPYHHLVLYYAKYLLSLTLGASLPEVP